MPHAHHSIITIIIILTDDDITAPFHRIATPSSAYSPSPPALPSPLASPHSIRPYTSLHSRIPLAAAPHRGFHHPTHSSNNNDDDDDEAYSTLLKDH
eukprot:CCRYP_014873-RA/>CCRYP_014873-RA protein AED:0.44 eAED:0.44 QI:0/-1/0/1/-1/1/1/0/96